MTSNGVDHSPDEALTAALERESERRDGQVPDDNYLVWLAEQQIAKQSNGELEERQEILDALTTVRLDFRHVGERDAAIPDAKPVIRRKHPVDISKSIRGEDLLLLDLPPLKWIVPDLIPEGTTLLAAPPKIGKSSLIYQACVEIACDGSLLGRKVARGNVLYAALEDGPRRGQMKLRTALAGRKLPPDTLEIWWNAPAIGEGLEERLAEWIERVPHPVLVAIDTLERIRPEADPRTNAYRVDVRHVSALQSAFRDSDVGLLIVHHARKEKGDDFVQAVSGTYGLTGSVDTIVSIERRRNDPYAIIRATGREVGEIELPARLSGNGTWEWAQEAMAATASSERLEVFQIIQKKGPIWPKLIAAIMGKEGESGRVSVQQMVSKLVSDGVIEKGARGYSVHEDATAYADYSGTRNVG